MDFLSLGVKGLTPLIVLSRDEDIRSGLLIFMFVLCPPVPVNITSPPSASRVPLGKQPVMSCSAYGFPVPTLSWVFHGKPLAGTKRLHINITIDDGNLMVTSTLQFAEVTRRDSGLYTCQANNSIGPALAEVARLVVLGEGVYHCTTESVDSYSQIIGHSFWRVNMCLTQIAQNFLKILHNQNKWGMANRSKLELVIHQTVSNPWADLGKRTANRSC